MPQYNLTSTQVQILTSWLYEPSGYLQQAINDLGVSAKDWLEANPGGDLLTDYHRVSSPHPNTHIDDWNGAVMVWWIMENDQVNIQPPNRPEETPTWVALLQEWDISINAGFGRVPQNERDTNTRPLWNKLGVQDDSIPSGSHLAQQQQIITKVLSVLV